MGLSISILKTFISFNSSKFLTFPYRNLNYYISQSAPQKESRESFPVMNSEISVSGVAMVNVRFVTIEQDTSQTSNPKCYCLNTHFVAFFCQLLKKQKPKNVGKTRLPWKPWQNSSWQYLLNLKIIVWFILACLKLVAWRDNAEPSS